MSASSAAGVLSGRRYRVRLVMRREKKVVDADGVREEVTPCVYPDKVGYTFGQAVDVLSIFHHRWASSNRRPEDEPFAVDAATGRRAFTYPEAISGELLSSTLATMLGRAVAAKRAADRLVSGA